MAVYRRPSVAVPAAFRHTTATTAQAESRSLADLNCFDLFKDDTLAELVRAALVQNFDLRIAAERVLQARERFGIARADRLPLIVDPPVPLRIGYPKLARGRSRLDSVRTSRTSSRIRPRMGIGRVGTDPPGERSGARPIPRHRGGAASVITTLIADVTDAYFSLQTLDRQLAIAQRTRATCGSRSRSSASWSSTTIERSIAHSATSLMRWPVIT